MPKEKDESRLIYKCKLCGHLTITKWGMLRHLNKAHPDELEEVTYNPSRR